MAEELKPCPFCGGKAKVKGICGSESVYAFVYCQKCGARTEKTYEFEAAKKEQLERIKAHVSALWNARV